MTPPVAPLRPKSRGRSVCSCEHIKIATGEFVETGSYLYQWVRCVAPKCGHMWRTFAVLGSKP